MTDGNSRLALEDEGRGGAMGANLHFGNPVAANPGIRAAVSAQRSDEEVAHGLAVAVAGENNLTVCPDSDGIREGVNTFCFQHNVAALAEGGVGAAIAQIPEGNHLIRPTPEFGIPAHLDLSRGRDANPRTHEEAAGSGPCLPDYEAPTASE